jgi:membrane dipeptidase
MQARPIVHTAALAALLLSTTAFAAPARSPEQIAAAALAAAPVWDGHNDVPEQLRDRRKNLLAGFDFADTSNTANPASEHPGERLPMQTDLARLRLGHVGAQFWSVYVSAGLPEPQAVQATLEQIDVMKRVIAANPQTMQFVTSAADAERAMQSGHIASLIGMEGGHSIGGSLAVLRQMHALGARYMTLTHFRNNAWADSGTDAPAHGGLTPFGKDVVREMQRLGMLVDLSHTSQKTMLDALDVARAPVIFSHSGAMAISDHPRNVSDAVLNRLKANGGLIMVNFYPAYVSADLRAWNADRAATEARGKALFPDQPATAAKALADWEVAHPKPVATLAQVADHIDHVVRRIGADHVGLGGDFDGGSVGLQGLPDVSAYPALFVELARRGYSQADLEKIASRNMLRVLRAADAFAAAHRGDPVIENEVSF